MFELMKIVGVSAVLSAGFVTASEMQAQPEREPASAKIYTERLPQGDAVPARALRITYAAGSQAESRESRMSTGLKGDLLQKAPHGACASQAWPNIAPECLQSASGVPVRSSVRMITVEQREGANTSVLVRVPSPELAQR
jgi:hypothetical protein